MLFRRRYQKYKPDKEALNKILSEEPPPAAGSTPITMNFSRGRLIGQAIGFVFGIGLLVFLGRTLYSDTEFVVFFGVFLLVTHAAAFVADPTMFDLSITVSGEGVRMRKLFSEKLVQWWEHPAVTATPDLVVIRVASSSQRVTATLLTQTADRRVEFAQALRAWTRQYGNDMTEATPPARFVRGVASTVLVVVVGGAAILGGTFFLSSANTLGIRCSSNGAYFQQTFGTPPRQGCAVLRVSAGAEKAGIRQGDLMIELNGIPITSGTQFSIVFAESTRRRYSIKVVRGVGQTLDFDVQLGKSRTFAEDPNDPIYYYLRARGEAGDHPNDAIADYSKVIGLAPQFDLAYLYRADLYDQTGDHQSATADYHKAIDLSPTLGEAYRFLAQHERDANGDLLSASTHAHKAIELDKCAGAFEEHNVDCNDDYYLLGVLEAKYYDVNEPIAAAEQAIRFWPKAPEPYCLLATLYERAGDMTKAVTSARQYLDFPAADRFPQCEPDAKRILGLGESGSGGGPTMVTATAVPSGGSTPTPIRIEAGASGTPVASGIANCIDFRESSTCAPF